MSYAHFAVLQLHGPNAFAKASTDVKISTFGEKIGQGGEGGHKIDL